MKYSGKIIFWACVLAAGAVLWTGFMSRTENCPPAVIKVKYSWWKPVSVEIDYDGDGITDAAYLYSKECPYDQTKLNLKPEWKDGQSLAAEALLLRRPNSEHWGVQIVNRGKDQDNKDIYEVSILSDYFQGCVLTTCNSLNQDVFEEIYKAWGKRFGEDFKLKPGLGAESLDKRN